MRDPHDAHGHGGHGHDGHGHGGHGHDEHNGLPPPEPENVAIGPVLIWGGISFLFVLVSIALVGSYFWYEREIEVTKKVSQYGSNIEKVRLLHAQEAQHLNEYKNLGEGHYQIPVSRAMELVIQDYQARPINPVQPPPVQPLIVPPPVDPNAPGTLAVLAPATDAAPDAPGTP